MMRLLIALLVLCTANISSAGMQSPRNFVKAPSGASEFCSGTELFCTSWESGTDALNTGATGNEDVFTSSAGTISRGAYSYKGDYGFITSTNNSYVGAVLGTYAATELRMFFELSSESMGSGQLAYLIEMKNSTNTGDLIDLYITDDASTSDSNVLARCKAHNGTSLVDIGDIAITLNTRYEAVLRYSNISDTVSCEILNETGTQVGIASETTTSSASIGRFYIGPQSYTFGVKIGAIKVTE